MSAGTVIIPSQPKTASSTHWHIGLGWSALTNLHYSRKMTTSEKTLLACKFPPWTLNSLQLKFNHRHNTNNPHTARNGQHNSTNSTASRIKIMFIVVSYTRKSSEKFKKTCNSLGIQVHFKGNNTIWTLLMAP